MCDYSLRNVASRSARIGDKLVSTSFLTSCTRGFAAIGEPNIAVCACYRVRSLPLKRI
jgi:hypothetical protein